MGLHSKVGSCFMTSVPGGRKLRRWTTEKPVGAVTIYRPTSYRQDIICIGYLGSFMYSL
jgi:hypothetical protein